MADLLDTPVDDATAPNSERQKQLLGYGNALLQDGRARRRHAEGTWWENLAFLTGDFWVQWDAVNRKLREPPKPADHRVRMAINLVQPAARTELAKLTKNRPIMDALARSADEQDLNSAKVADKILNDYIERKFNMPRLRKRMLNWVIACGEGGMLVDWDDTAMGEIDVFHNQEGHPIFNPELIEKYKAEYEQSGYKPQYKKIQQGEMIMKVVSPFSVIWDFSKNHFEDAMWCIYSEAMDVDEIERRWNARVAPDANATPDVIQNRILSRFDYTNTLKEKAPKSQRLAMVHQLWVKPGHTKFPNGVCLVFTEDRVIDEREYSYGHGELPIVMMSHVELPTSQRAMSVIQQMRAPVLELSKTQSQLIENRNLMANPPWAIPRQLRIDQEIQNKPGLRLVYDYLPNVPEPKPIQMPEMPKYVTDMVEALKETIREISGQGETSQGKVPPGARSGVAIAYLQEEDDTRLGPVVAEFEETMEGIAYRQLRVIAEKYTTPRIIPIYKSNGGEPEVYDFLGNMLEGTFGVRCRSGSALPRSKAAKQQFILDLWDRKLEQDPRKVRQMLEISEGEPDEWEVDLSQAEEENHELRAGEDPGVEEWYNHPAHHYIHRNYMKSSDFKKLSKEQKEVFQRHDTMHTQAEQRQAQEMAAQQAAMGGPQQQGGGGSAPAPGGEGGGQNRPEGPPAAFGGESPAQAMEAGPQ